jgi:GTP cyclohydrolase IA
MTEMTEIVVALGSNIEREANIAEAIRLMRRHRGIEVERVSQVYESKAVGSDGAPDFYNAAVLARTNLDPKELRDELRKLEHALGRVRTDDRNAPRTIDLDVVYYGDLVEQLDGWEIPAPDAVTAAYIALPVADVAPTFIHPATSESLSTIAAKQSADTCGTSRVPDVRIAPPHVPRGGDDWDVHSDVYAPKFESLVYQQLLELGEDPEREGLARTPQRVARALDYLTSGYSTTLDEVVNDAVFDAESAEEMVLVKDIEFYSLCEHHMLPFFGKAAVAYLPKGQIIGLSKLARIVDLYARRLQVQERMTNQIADAVDEVLAPHGVAVIIEGAHFCMMMRGVQKQESSTVTSAMRGTFKSDARTRAEVLQLIRG